MSDQFFHILNRGVEKRKIFFNKEDHLRFADNIRDLNNQEIALLSYENRRKYSEVSAPKKNLVDVLCWSMLPNHFHVMVRSKTDKGASIFAQKLTGGYTMYFNPRRKRSGTLFQGRSKVIPISHEAHFIHLPFYVLANPLDMFQSGWREDGIADPEKAVEFLENYPWSSFRELVKSVPSAPTTNRKLFFELFDTNEKRVREDLREWMHIYNKNPKYIELLTP